MANSNKDIPEITVKAVIIALIITVILAASNAYLGLKIGTTISASIPAAVMAMGVLRFFKNSNILETNMIQTAATAGEGLAAAIGYVLPALIILHYWQNFNYWQTVAISLIGGILGVLFSIPLRRVLLNEQNLPFPEGTAIGGVLQASASGKSYMKQLLQGGIISAVITICQTGFKLVGEQFYVWGSLGKTLFGFGIGFSPAIIASGYIVGFRVGLTMLVGTVIGWLLGIPILTSIYSTPPGLTEGARAMYIWSNHIRYIGVGTMLVGGIWTMLTMLKPIFVGITTSFGSLRHINEYGAASIPRTDRDIPIIYVLWGIIILAIPLTFLLIHTISAEALGISHNLWYMLIGFAVLYVLIAGFISASVCGYITGLVGSTNSPLSGIILSVILILALLLEPMLGAKLGDDQHKIAAATAIVIMIAAVVASVSAISTDTVQDLKAGQIIGATPWRQQLMLIIGVVVSSFVIAPVLQLLFNAYGIGGVMPRTGMSSSQMLAAPQAGLMAAVAQGAFSHNLPWGMIGAGFAIAAVVIVVDEMLKKVDMRLPVLAIGLGIYLPLDITTPIFVGSLISLLVKRRLKRVKSIMSEDLVQEARQRSMMLACGLVAGSSLMGVALAIPFALYGDANILQLVSNSFQPGAEIIGIAATIFLCYWLYISIGKIPKHK